MGKLNCSCANNTQETTEVVFNPINPQQLLCNIKSKTEDVFSSVEIISPVEFDEKLNTFPNSKELLNEYDLQITDSSQTILISMAQSVNSETKDKKLIQLPNPIKLIDRDENLHLFNGFINSDYNIEGKGCYITDNFIYNGFFQNNEFNGKGIMIYKDGSSLFGDWVNGLCTGKGTLRIKNQYEYEGNFFENKKQGSGKIKYPEGSSYEGEFQDNKKNGKGIYIFNNGETYEGEFKNDLYNGKGIYKWPSESREYRGEFKNGNMDGKGINKFNDGSIYEGFYKNGIKYGVGKYIWPNGSVFHGSWINNKLNGIGRLEINDEKYDVAFRFGKIISIRKAEDLEENKKIKFEPENIVDKEKLD